jgi:hypothetical protein
MKVETPIGPGPKKNKKIVRNRRFYCSPQAIGFWLVLPETAKNGKDPVNPVDPV